MEGERLKVGALGPLAVLVGWLTAVALTVGVRTFVEYPLLQLPDPGAGLAPAALAWVRVGYGTLAAAAGGVATAALAPRAPLGHATALAVLAGLTALAYALPDRPGEPTGHDLVAVLLPAAAVLVGAGLRTLVSEPSEQERGPGR